MQFFRYFFAKELQIRKGKGNLKIGWIYRLVTSFLFKKWFLAITVKTYAKTDTKILWLFPILLEFLTFGKLFWQWLWIPLFISLLKPSKKLCGFVFGKFSSRFVYFHFVLLFFKRLVLRFIILLTVSSNWRGIQACKCFAMSF